MDISLLNILRTVSWDFRRDMAQNYANALKNAIELHINNDIEKKQGFFLSKKGSVKVRGNFEDKLYVGNIHRIENHLYWNDEELADDDQIVDVVYIDGPVTRDGGGCSYGTKDRRDQVMYANTIPQVVGHIFIINTPGGESACRNDYEMMIDDCREKQKPTVAFVDGMCCSSGVNLSSRCDRTIVMNPKDDFGCIGSMAAFWATPDGAVDQDGTRYVEIVGDEAPDKNGWFRKAAKGDYEELQKLVNDDTNEFHQTVRDNRPLVTDDMLTGKVFEAQELIPALVDEIGDFNRALDAVFELAAGTLPAARTVVGGEQPDEKPEEPEQPNEQPDEPEQPAPEEPEDEPETSSRQQGNTVADEEEKEQTAQDVEQTPVSEQQADGTAAPEMSAENEQQKTESEDSKPSDEEKPAEDAQAPNYEAEKPAEVEDAAELAKAKDALLTAEGIIADRDKSIAEKDATISENIKTIADREKSIVEKDALIAQLKKQVDDLKGEVKELAAAPTPMTAGAQAPQDNGTGAAETGAVKSVVKPGMSADEIRETLRKQDEEIAEKRRRR